MSQRSFYDILGVSASADAEEIRRAYRAIARANHPDRTQDDPEKSVLFHQATVAYQTLSDPQKRKIYDRGHVGVRSVQDLFFKTHAGKRLMEAMLPSAPAAQQRGDDLMIVVEVDRMVLEQGGVATCSLVSPYEETRTDVSIQIPEGAHKHPWCRIEQYGGKGKNRAQFGDLLILFREKTVTSTKV